MKEIWIELRLALFAASLTAMPRGGRLLLLPRAPGVCRAADDASRATFLANLKGVVE